MMNKKKCKRISFGSSIWKNLRKKKQMKNKKMKKMKKKIKKDLGKQFSCCRGIWKKWKNKKESNNN